MKKIVVVFSVIFVLLCIAMFPCRVFARFDYADRGDILIVLQEKREDYIRQRVAQRYIKEYGQEYIDMIDTLMEFEYTHIEEVEAISILFFSDALEEDCKKSFLLSRKASALIETEEDRDIEDIQYFNFEGKDYLLCGYTSAFGRFDLYSFEADDEAKTIFESRLFSEGNEFEYRMQYVYDGALSITVRYFVPVLIVMTLLFVPIFIFDKKGSGIENKLGKRAAIVGFIAVPLIFLIQLARLYL